MTTEIIQLQPELPSTIEDKSKEVLTGRHELAAFQHFIESENKKGLLKEDYEKLLAEAQKMGEVVLDAETSLGELLLKEPKSSGGNRKKIKNQDALNYDQKPGKTDRMKKLGFSRNQVSDFQKLAKNKDIVEETKAESRKNGTIVIRADVLKKIKARKHQEKVQEQKSRPKTSNRIDIFKAENKYRIIYANPTWTDSGGTDHCSMTLDEVCRLPVPAADDAVLFLWVTPTLLEEGLKIAHEWGFSYQDQFIWDKMRHNVGRFNATRHEILLICTKGMCKPDGRLLYNSILSIEKSRSGIKPEEFRNVIDKLYVNGNRLEMFSLEAPEGWDVWSKNE